MINWIWSELECWLDSWVSLVDVVVVDHQVYPFLHFFSLHIWLHFAGWTLKLHLHNMLMTLNLHQDVYLRAEALFYLFSFFLPYYVPHLDSLAVWEKDSVVGIINLSTLNDEFLLCAVLSPVVLHIYPKLILVVQYLYHFEGNLRLHILNSDSLQHELPLQWEKILAEGGFSYCFQLSRIFYIFKELPNGSMQWLFSQEIIQVKVAIFFFVGG